MNPVGRPSLVARVLVWARRPNSRLVGAGRARRRSSSSLDGTLLDPTPLTPEAVNRHVTRNLAGTLTLELPGITYFSLEPERRWPAFAAIETGDGLDGSMRGLEPGSFRLSVMVGHGTLERVRHETMGLGRDTADVLLPHPTYDGLCWLSILNPTAGRFDMVVGPRLADAHRAMRSRLGMDMGMPPVTAGQSQPQALGYLDL